MNYLKNKLFLFAGLLVLFVVRTDAQNGMHFDNEHAFLIPMLEDNVMRGHAYVYLLDKISKDSNSFVIQVFDEYLHDLGEKKFIIDSKFSFHAAVFNGVNIVTKFVKAHEAVRYIVFDQKATIALDTTLEIKLQKVDKTPSDRSFRATPIFAVNNQGILDYLSTVSEGKNSTTVIYLGNDNKIWQNTYSALHPSNVQLLMADKRFVVNTVYNYEPTKNFNDVQTSVQILSAQGTKLAEVSMFKNDSISIYPISADIQKNGIEVISQFTTRAHEFSRIKYGTCIHVIDFSGTIVSQRFNEFTSTLAKDSVVKKYKLMTFSYLYMHKAIKLKNGNWLVAAEQLLRTKLRIRFGINHSVIFNKKSICLIEVDEHADVVKIHVEPNKEDGVKVPKKYYRRPQGGAMVANAKQGLDINYFVKDDKKDEENISFVFTDYNYHTKKLSLGNLLYKNGVIKTDRVVIPKFKTYTRVGIFPARYGHVILIKYDPRLGSFDFDNIKFNN